MARAQQGRKFTDDEAQRFAKLCAGFDTNGSPEESAVKGQMMRRMVAEKGLRLVDAWELPEIRDAIDRQSQPVRAVQKVQAANENCQSEPWPQRMLWMLIGMVTWGVKGLALGLAFLVVIVCAFALGCVAGCGSGLWKALWSDETWKRG